MARAYCLSNGLLRPSFPEILRDEPLINYKLSKSMVFCLFVAGQVTISFIVYWVRSGFYELSPDCQFVITQMLVCE